MEHPPSPSPGPTREEVNTPTPGPSGLPTPESTNSYWHSEPSAALLGHRTTEDLPRTADVVIVGSGITGAFAAWFLKGGLGGGAKGSGEESVVMLEAREACWGATGRNGGHIQPFLYASPPSAARFELATYTFLRQFISNHNIPCSYTDLSGVHAFLSEPLWSDVQAAVTRNRALHPDLLATVEVVSDRGRLGELGVPGVKGAVVQEKAGSLWPYKLVAFVLERLLERYGRGGDGRGFNLQTKTPVLGVHPVGDGGGWTVNTPRGAIHARKVLLATNGYTSHLLPTMADLIVPVRGQVGALVPPFTSSSSPTPSTSTTTTGDRDQNRVDVSTRYSYCFFAEGPTPVEKRDEYLIQRPSSSSSSSDVPGYFIYGGGRSLARNRAVGSWRDDEVETEVTQFLQRNLIPRPLDFSTTTAPGTQTELKPAYQWTGIMGYSRDGHPWVGPVGGDGLFVAAGYSGHGMPNAVLAAHAVVRSMRGEDLGKGGKGGVDGVGYTLPGEFLVTGERVERARAGRTVGEMDLGGWGAEFAMLGRV